MNANVRCLKCNRKTFAKDFIDMVSNCNIFVCPHRGKTLSWNNTILETTEKNKVSNVINSSPSLPSEEEQYEHTPIGEFIFRNKVI